MESPTLYSNRPASAAFIKRISWSAIFGGVLIAIVTQLLLSLLGLGIGLGTIDPIEEKNPTAGLGIESAIWYIISSLAALFVGGSPVGWPVRPAYSTASSTVY